MLGVEADLEGQHGGVVNRVGADHLGLVVLSGRGLGAEPHLDAVAPRALAQGAQLAGHDAPQRLRDLVEEGQLHQTIMVDGGRA